MIIRLLTALLILSLAPSAIAAEDAYHVIVHPGVEIGSVERTFLRDAFLKKRTRWADDQLIRPVDHDQESNARRKFSQEVLGRSVSAVKSYWQQVLFSGRDIPPPELDSDAEIVRWVQSHEGAIGYVSARADTSGVRVVSIK